MTAIRWIRRDLRLTDNLALQAALEAGPVLPVFILDPALFSRPAPRRQAFLFNGLRALEADLRQRSSYLALRSGHPLEVNAYRVGTFMPGLVLGIIPFFIAIFTGSGDLIWFSLLHTTAASGDWLILWIIRSIKPGSMVEDHPTNAGCYVLKNA